MQWIDTVGQVLLQAMTPLNLILAVAVVYLIRRAEQCERTHTAMLNEMLDGRARENTRLTESIDRLRHAVEVLAGNGAV